MDYKECEHCLTKVYFSADGICPSCRKDSKVKSIKTKNQILIEQEQSRAKEQIAYCKKQGPEWIVGGGALTLFAVLFTVGSIASGPIAVLWYGGIIVGLGIAAKGLNLLRDAKEIEYFSKQKIEELSKLELQDEPKE